MHGGLKLQHRPASDIETLPTPPTLRIPIQQHQGPAAPVIVTVGESVVCGQPLSMSTDLRQVPVHASLGGTVTDISRTDITITTNDSCATWQPWQASPLPNPHTQQSYINHFHQRGLVGLGGACFPVAAKIDAHKNTTPTLVINAAECDPDICCDEALLQQCGAAVFDGVAIAMQATAASRCVVFIEQGKKTDTAAMQKLVSDAGLHNTDVVAVPAIYPSGAETQMLSHVSGQRVARNSYNTSPPMISFNIGTCYAMSQSIAAGQPLVARITTVIDHNSRARNFSIPIGTPLSHLAASLGLPDTTALEIFSGGRMMRREITLNSVVTKSHNCIEFTVAQPPVSVRECIRCGLCADACPEKLQPQQLYINAKAHNESALVALNLNSCIECRCCDHVCPSKLPLTALYQQAKTDLAVKHRSKLDADIAKQRFDKRALRLQRLEAQKADRLAAKKDTLSNKKSTSTLNKKQLIEQALQRAQAKKQHIAAPASPTNREADQ